MTANTGARQLRTYALALLCIALSLAVYAPALTAFFQGDDFDLLLLIRDAGPFGSFSYHSSFFRPLISLSLYLNGKISGLSPFGFHATNLIVHGLSAFFIYRIGCLLFANHRLAFLSGILFLILPAHVEAVFWISGRTDVFASCGALASFWCYLEYSRNHQRRWIVPSVILFGAALLCKEAVVTLPFIILIHEWFTSTIRRLSASPLFIGTVVFYVIVRRLILGVWIGGYGASVHTSPSLSTLIRGLILYPLRAFFPHVPGEYLPVSGLISSIGVILRQGTSNLAAIFLLLTIGIVAIFSIFYIAKGLFKIWQTRNSQFRNPSLLVFLGTCFAVSLLPILSLSSAISLTDSEGGRLLYFPSAFSVLWTVAFVHRVARRQRTVFAALGLLYGVSLVHTNQTWKQASNVAAQLLRQSLAQTPDRPMILINKPDNLAGAYVFRNGLGTAWQLFGGRGLPPIVLTAHTMQRPLEPIAARIDATTIVVELQQPNYFRPVFPSPASVLAQPVVVTETSPTKTIINLASLPRAAKLMIFSSGRLEELRRF